MARKLEGTQLVPSKPPQSDEVMARSLKALEMPKDIKFDVASDRKKLQCSLCSSYWFETEEALRLHISTHLMMQRTTRKQSDDPRRPWQCEICNRKFAEKCTLKRHIRIHTNEKPWKCQHCTKAFNQSCSLQAHLRIHTGERPFPCLFCEKRFRQSTHRRQHMKRCHREQWEKSQREQ